MKKCTKCKINKSLTEFQIRYDYPDRYQSWCKTCHYELQKKYRKLPKYKTIHKEYQSRKREEYKHITIENIPEKITCSICKKDKKLDEFIKDKGSKYGVDKRCKICNRARDLILINKPAIKKRRSRYIKKYMSMKKNKERANRLSKIKYKHNTAFSLSRRMSSSINESLRLRQGSKNNKPWETLVGYTLDELIIHLEKLFLPGMSWKNRHLWHIDHIIPKHTFCFRSYEDDAFKQCWSLSNLRPLWAEDNLARNRKTNI